MPDGCPPKAGIRQGARIRSFSVVRSHTWVQKAAFYHVCVILRGATAPGEAGEVGEVVTSLRILPL